MDFKAPLELWNPLIKALYGKFHGSGMHSKRNSLREVSGWQIVLIFNTMAPCNGE